MSPGQLLMTGVNFYGSVAADREGNQEGKWVLTSKSGCDMICFGAPETWIISKPETEQMDFIKAAKLLFDDNDGCRNNLISMGKASEGLEFTVTSVSLVFQFVVVFDYWPLMVRISSIGTKRSKSQRHQAS